MGGPEQQALSGLVVPRAVDVQPASGASVPPAASLMVSPGGWKKAGHRAARLLLLASLLFAAAAFVPTPYYLKAPGRADDLSHMVAVSGGRRDFAGKLMMTTVIYERANFFFCLYATLDSQSELETQEPVHLRRPHFVSLPVWHMSQMEASKLSAKLAAMRFLRIPVGLQADGVRILSFLNQAPAKSLLETGDVISRIDTMPVKSYGDLHDLLRPHKAGDQVRVEVERAGTTLDRDVPLISQEGQTIIGVQVENAFDTSDLPRQVDINSRAIQGGSAGLMFTLEIIRQMEGVDLTRGNVVAGTGTIDPDGSVGPVEGVPQKLVAAERAGATVFLVPEENVEDLPHQHPGVRVVPVRTLRDAMAALAKLPPKLPRPRSWW
ncbi:MAG TPA: PDZ domain-containing protein [Candidatus Xenobia bacterium]